MTFKELQDDVLERTTFDSSAGLTSARKRIKRFINEIYRRVARTTGVGRLSTATATISTVANTAEYVVTTAQVRSVYNATQGSALSPITLAEIRLLDPQSSALGQPTHFAVTKNGATTVTVRLYPTPVETLTLDLDTGGALTELAADADVPVLPIDFHYLLGTGARMLEAEKMQQINNYKIAKTELREGVSELRLFLARSRRALTRARKPAGSAYFAVQPNGWVDWNL